MNLRRCLLAIFEQLNQCDAPIRLVANDARDKSLIG